MKTNNIRKNVIFGLTLFLSFLLYADVVKAENTGIGPNQSLAILPSNIYTDVTCEMTVNTNNFYTLTRNDDMYGNYSNYTVTAAAVANNERGEVECSYKKIGSPIEYKSTYYFTNNNGESTYANKYRIDRYIALQFHESKTRLLYNVGVYNASNVSIDRGTINGNGYTISVFNNEVYIDYSDATYSDNVIEEVFNVTYTYRNEEITAEVHITFDYRAKMVIYPGNYGTCDMTGWEYNSQYRGYTQDVNSYSTVTLPNCSNESARYPNLVLEFKGWALRDNIRDATYDSAQCEERVVASGGSTITPKIGDVSYYSCFKIKTVTTISVDYGTPNGWEHVGNANMYRPSNYNDDNVTLPEIPESSIPEGIQFEGYYYNNQSFAPGTTVPNDGKNYHTRFTFSSIFLGYDEYMRDVKKGENVIFALSGKSITCSTTDSRISVNSQNGECIITGNESTHGEYDAVVNVDADGKTYTLKVAVADNYGDQKDHLFYYDPYTGQWHDGSESNGQFVPGGGSSPGSVVDDSTGCTYDMVGIERPGNGYIDSLSEYGPTSAYTYKVKVVCGLVNETYGSMCLDPGLHSPDYEPFVLDRMITSAEGGNLDKVVMNILNDNRYEGLEELKTLLLDPTSVTKALYNTTVRIGDYLDHGCSGSSDSGGAKHLTDHNLFYESVCREFSSTHTLSRASGTDVQSAYYWVPDPLDVVQLLTTTPSGSESGTFVSPTVTKTVELVGGVYTADVTITGAGLDGASYTINCEGGTCNSPDPLHGTISGDTLSLHLTFEGGEPTEKGWGISINYAMASSAQLLVPADGGEVQRLIVIGIPPKIFIPIASGEGLCPATFAEWRASSNFINKDCCNKYRGTITDQEELNLFNAICDATCKTESVSNVCNVGIAADESRDILSYEEASVGGVDTFGNCSVFTESGRLIKYGFARNGDLYRRYTSLLSDSIGNKISVKKFDNNNYCRYTCAERYKWSFESYPMHVGVNSAFAGAEFVVDKDTYISSQTVCVSTYVDYEKYARDMERLTNVMTAYYNQFSEASLVLWNLDYGTPTNDSSEGNSGYDNHRKVEINNKHVCYHYGTSKEFKNELYCGHNDGGYSSGKCSASDSEDATDGSGSWYKNCVDQTTSFSTSNGCPSGYAPVGSGSSIICYRHYIETAKTCYGHTDGTTYDEDSVKFDCYDYEIVTDKTNSDIQYQMYVNNDLTDKVNGVNGTNIQYAIVQDSLFDNTNTINTNSSNKGTPSTSVSKKYDIETGDWCNPNDNGYCQTNPVDIQTTCGETGNDSNIFCETNGTNDGGRLLFDENNDSVAYNNLIEKLEYTPNSSYSHSAVGLNEFNATDDPYKFDDIAEFGIVLLNTSNVNLQTIINNAHTNIENIGHKMIELAKDFEICQNVKVVNTEGSHSQSTLPSEGYDPIVSQQSNLSKVQATASSMEEKYIKVNYKPEISYTYDEVGYMGQISSNKLVENVDGFGHIDESSGQTMWYYANQVHSNNYTGYCDPDYPDLCVKVNVVKEDYYKDTTKVGWDSGSTEGQAYEGGDSETRTVKVAKLLTCATYVDDDWKGRSFSDYTKGECEVADFNMYIINYNKLSISNAAFYSNDGLWVSSNVTDNKKHIDADTNNIVVASETDRGNRNSTVTNNINSAAAMFNEIGSNWDIMGASHNTFPIKFDTPRDVYQYAYSMTDFGTYWNTSNLQLGRIMGYKESIIKTTTYSCFYEVQEQFCECCGAKINTTVHQVTQVPNETGMTPRDGDRTRTTTDVNANGQLGFYASSVNLNNLAGQTGLLGNWDMQNVFYLTKRTGATNSRGSELKDYIESNGDTVYEESNKFIEYSYTLTPAAIVNLRTTEFTYGINVEEVKTTTTDYNYHGGNASGTGNIGTLTPTFTHLKSKWLEEVADEWITEGYETTNYTKRSDVCTISSISDLQSRKSDMNCRWYDWYENDYRTAFK